MFANFQIQANLVAFVLTWPEPITAQHNDGDNQIIVAIIWECDDLATLIATSMSSLISVSLEQMIDIGAFSILFQDVDSHFYRGYIHLPVERFNRRNSFESVPEKIL